MINDSGYFIADERGAVDTGSDIAVNSAGHYKLLTRPLFETTRPLGRVDFQLLYIAEGSVRFRFEDGQRQVGEGHAVLYYPGDSQHYWYDLADQPDAYWVHFTGHQAEAALAQMGLCKSGVYHTGPQSEFALLTQKMIQELQIKKSRYYAMANLYMKEMLELLARYSASDGHARWEGDGFVEKAIVDFHQSYHLPIQINEYARRLNISPCWFIRCFKRYTGRTPQQYLCEIRMGKAKELLYFSSFSCGEIAQSIGYADPLYFGRVFKQAVGVSPLAYRKGVRGRLDSL